MTFSEWIKAEGLTLEEAGRRIGVRHPGTVRRYVLGIIPRHPDRMRAIVSGTGGAVTEADFYRLGSAHEGDAV